MGYINKLFCGKNEKDINIIEDIEKIINNNESMLIFDSNEKYYNKSKELLENNGYEIIKLNLKDINDGELYNPFVAVQNYYNNKEIDKAIELINNIFSSLIGESLNSDPFWEIMASSYLSGLAYHLLSEEKPVTFKSIFKLLLEDSNLKELFDKKDVLDPARVMAGATIYSPNETKGGIISVAKQKLRNLLNKPQLLEKISNDKNIDLKEKLQVIFIINLETNEESNKLTKMYISLFLNLIYENKISYNLVLDYFDILNNNKYLENDLISSKSNKLNLFVGVNNIDSINKNLFDEIINCD